MPQPIDFSTELGRMTAVERIQQVTDRLSLNAQQRSTNEVQEQRIASETQVQETQAQSEKVDVDLHRRNPYAGRKKKKEESPPVESASDVPVAPEEQHQLDISI
jgi:hypothetical protein